ncbi:hypothetical protein HL670_01953 [Serratia plymuthica]|uniref:colicin E1 family microcin immunity protein n=1 Tax=Serratia plymuthica TaxID=82996 RepID=UPI00148DFB1A|nr:hypothetical protein HL670_01953 [Serratia plymuthica]
MTKAFYLKYLVYGSLWGCLAAYIYYNGFNHGHSIGMYLMFGLSAVLFPLAKFLIEALALKYTTREFWTRGCWLKPLQKMAFTPCTIWFVLFFLSLSALSIS